MDWISILSFLIGLENLGLNATQSDVQSIAQAIAERSDQLLKEIHKHLEEQDEKINIILEAVKNENN